jgi:hypothetical protein
VAGVCPTARRPPFLAPCPASNPQSAVRAERCAAPSTDYNTAATGRVCWWGTPCHAAHDTTGTRGGTATLNAAPACVRAACHARQVRFACGGCGPRADTGGAPGADAPAAHCAAHSRHSAAAPAHRRSARAGADCAAEPKPAARRSAARVCSRGLKEPLCRGGDIPRYVSRVCRRAAGGGGGGGGGGGRRRRRTRAHDRGASPLLQQCVLHAACGFVCGVVHAARRMACGVVHAASLAACRNSQQSTSHFAASSDREIAALNSHAHTHARTHARTDYCIVAGAAQGAHD